MYFVLLRQQIKFHCHMARIRHVLLPFAALTSLMPLLLVVIFGALAHSILFIRAEVKKALKI